jgi:hypothetical protein
MMGPVPDVTAAVEDVYRRAKRQADGQGRCALCTRAESAPVMVSFAAPPGADRFTLPPTIRPLHHCNVACSIAERAAANIEDANVQERWNAGAMNSVDEDRSFARRTDAETGGVEQSAVLNDDGSLAGRAQSHVQSDASDPG